MLSGKCFSPCGLTSIRSWSGGVVCRFDSTIGAAVAQIETERTVLVDKQTETASVAAGRTG